MNTNLPANPSLKSTDMEAVRTAVAILCTQNDNTSTLEVKSLLRKNDYHATQKEVSALMHKMADEGLLSTIDTGTYCLFSVVQIVAAPIQIN